MLACKAVKGKPQRFSQNGVASKSNLQNNNFWCAGPPNFLRVKLPSLPAWSKIAVNLKIPYRTLTTFYGEHPDEYVVTFGPSKANVWRAMRDLAAAFEQEKVCATQK